MKKIGIIIALVVALVGGVFAYFSFAVMDEEAFAKALQTRLSTALKREVTVGDVERISLFPAPHLSVHSVVVKNAPDASQPEWVSVPEVRVSFPWGAFLKGDVSAYRMVLVTPSVHLEVLPQGRGNWAEAMNGLGEVFSANPVEVKDASFVYTDVTSAMEVKADGISITITPAEGGYAAKGTWKYGEDTYAVDASWKSPARAQTGLTLPLEVKLVSDREQLAWQGDVTGLDARPQLKGKFTLEGGEKSPFLHHQLGTLPDGMKPMKLQFSADVQLDSRAMVVRNGKLDVKDAANAQVLDGVVQWNYLPGAQPQLHWSGAFEQLNADFFAAFSPKFASGDKNAPEDATFVSRFSSFLKSHAGTLQGYAKDVTHNGQKLPYVQWQADVVGGEMHVKRFMAALPGEGQLTADGEVRLLSNDLLFIGKWEAQGAELTKALQVLWPAPENKTQPALGHFAVKSNIAWDKEQLRLSEFQARAGDVLMGGALVFKNEDRLKVESFMKLVNLDVDKVLAFAGAYVESADNEMVVDNPGDLFEQRYANRQFDWVNALGFDVTAGLSLQNFTLFEKAGKQADFTLRLTSSSVGLEQLRADYAGYQMGGDVSVTLQKSNNPLVKAQLVMNRFDAKDIFPELTASRDDKEWEDFLNRPLDLKLLQLYSMELDMRFGSLKVRDLVFDDLHVKANVENGRLGFDEFSGKLWDGVMNVRLALQAGSIPSLAMSFSMENMSLVRMAQSSRLLSSMAGTVRAAGEITTSGAVMRTWLTNAKGEIRLNANDLSIRGVGISTLSRAVPVARQVKDIVQAGEHALSSGITRITEMNGFITIENGEARTPRIIYKSPESEGTIEGEVDLVKENVNILMQFHLLNTVQQGRVPPLLKLVLQGEIDKIKKQLDTQELENYVSQAAAARALKN